MSLNVQKETFWKTNKHGANSDWNSSPNSLCAAFHLERSVTSSLKNAIPPVPDPSIQADVWECIQDETQPKWRTVKAVSQKWNDDAVRKNLSACDEQRTSRVWRWQHEQSRDDLHCLGFSSRCPSPADVSALWKSCTHMWRDPLRPACLPASAMTSTSICSEARCSAATASSEMSVAICPTPPARVSGLIVVQSNLNSGPTALPRVVILVANKRAHSKWTRQRLCSRKYVCKLSDVCFHHHVSSAFSLCLFS